MPLKAITFDASSFNAKYAKTVLYVESIMCNLKYMHLKYANRPWPIASKSLFYMIFRSS